MTGFTGEYWVERRVFAYEEITVNGVTYMAYGVRSTGAKANYTETYWYAPEIESTIKADSGGLELALVEYDLR